jgi:hypothetical protein
MKILNAVKSAAPVSLKAWKGILIVWFISLLLAGMLAIPMKGVLNSGFGKSMITGKLADGINLEAFTDLGATMKSLVSFFSKGLFLAVIIGILLNIFLSGGLFNAVKGSPDKFSAGEFFRVSSKNFWPFLIIESILYIIIVVLSIIIIAVPIAIVAQADSPSEGAGLKTGLIVISLFSLLSTVLLLVADYARAWQVSHDRNAGFRALAFGFSQTFRTFLSSYPLMIILLVVQVLYGLLVFRILAYWKPSTGGGVFLLFLLSQFLFIIKILLKVWRYGSVTKLMEENARITSASPDQSVSGSSLTSGQVLY